jgi:AcrR family transcriptional regulator
VFAERGYDGASISDLARAADVAGSVIYHYFGSKAGLWTSLLEAENQRLVDEVATAVAAQGSQGRRLPAGVDAYFAFVEQHRAAWRLLVREPPADPRLRDLHARLRRDRETHIAALYEVPVAQASARDDKTRFSGLVTTAIRAFASWWDENPDVPRTLVVDAVIAFSESVAERLPDRAHK